MKRIFPELNDNEINEILKAFPYKEKSESFYEIKEIDMNSVDMVVNLIGKDYPFCNFFASQLAKISNKLLMTILRFEEIVDVKCVFDKLIVQLADYMYNMSIRTLVCDIKDMKEKGKLEGKSTNEEYNYYNELLKDKTYLNCMQKKYSALFYLIDTSIYNCLSFIEEILERVNACGIELITINEEISGKIIGISLSKGDSHGDGRSVSEIIFEKGSIIYKPRSVKTEKNWEEISNYINKLLGKKAIVSARVLSYEGFGFQEKIEKKYINNDIELFNNIGRLLALLYSLNASDCHYENIVISGTHPVLVDTETLLSFNPNFKTDDSISGSVLKRLGTSVASIGLLKRKIRIGKNLLDVGLVEDIDEKDSKVKAISLVNKGTSEIEIKFIDRTAKDNGSIVYINPTRRQESLEALLKGFREIYTCIVENKDQLVRYVRNLFATADIRIIYAPTAFYGNLLDISKNPLFMKNEKFRHALFTRVALINKGKQKIIEYEIQELKKGDIPLYVLKANGSLIKTQKGMIVGITDNNPISEFEKKIMSMGKVDMQFQIEIINDIYYQFELKRNVSDFRWHNQQYKIGNIHSQLENCIKEILDYLCVYRSFTQENRFGNVERCFVGSSVVNMDKDLWVKSVNDFDLYDGHIGLAFVFMKAYKVLGEPDYKSTACEIINMICSNKEYYFLKFPVSTGLLKGIGGFLLFVSLYGEDVKLKTTEALIKLLKMGYKSMEYNSNIDFVAGNAGFAEVVLYLRKKHNEKEIQELIDNIIEKFVNLFKQTDIAKIEYSGFAHGLASLIPILYEIYKIYQDYSIYELFTKLLKYERDNFYCSVESKWWKDKNREEFAKGWCHGSPGLLLEKVKLYESGFRDSLIKKEISELIDDIKSNTFGCNYTMCHGDLGNMCILGYTARILGDKSLYMQVKSNFTKLLVMIENDKRIKERPIFKFNGIMVGMCGVVFAMLYYLDIFFKD